MKKLLLLLQLLLLITKGIAQNNLPGVFVWSDAKPDEKSRLPGGVEVQMLELDWVNQNIRDGVTPPIAYIHGELFWGRRG